MRILLQRVNHASVAVEDFIVGAIERGVMLLVGLGKDDTPAVFPKAAEKICSLRIFPDANGRFHFSVKDIGGGVLLVPQFTLYADTSKGRRPEFFGAMEPEIANIYFNQLAEFFRKQGVNKVECGRFGANMQVNLQNDGPVTIMFDFPPI